MNCVAVWVLQVFGIQLLAVLCGQYPLPKTMNVARLAINVMFTTLSGLEPFCFVILSVSFLSLSVVDVSIRPTLVLFQRQLWGNS